MRRNGAGLAALLLVTFGVLAIPSRPERRIEAAGPAVAAPAPAPAPSSMAGSRPNIIFVMADDVGWGDFQCYNPKGKIPSPNIDRLARGGMRFTDAHTPAALCAPTRYAVATGNYTWRGPIPGGTWGWNQGSAFLPGQKTVGHMLQEAGYRTGLFGKLHFGGDFEKNADGTPDFTKPMATGGKQWGFDCSYVLLGGHQSPPYCFFENNEVENGRGGEVKTLAAGPLNGGTVPSEGPGLPDYDSRQVGPKLVEKTVAFIDDCLKKGEKDGKPAPFYVHLSTDGAHGPYTPPDEIAGTPVKGQSMMTAHTDMVHEVDVVVGALVDALKKRDLMKNTLIIVTSDNGGLPFERDLGHDAVGGLRGFKSTIWEGGHRVPFVAHWGDGTKEGSTVPPGSVRDQVVGTHDIVATFTELAGVKPGPDQALDSVSLASVLDGSRGDDRPARASLLVQSGVGRDAFDGGDTTPTGPARNRAVAAAKKKNDTAKKKAASKKQGAAVAKKKGENKKQAAQRLLPSQNMSHAVRVGTWKLTYGIEDKPVALFDLSADLAEKNNLIDDPAHAERVRSMEQVYREIRASKRSAP
jgi:arylsulfatase A-like enzyme